MEMEDGGHAKPPRHRHKRRFSPEASPHGEVDVQKGDPLLKQQDQKLQARLKGHPKTEEERPLIVGPKRLESPPIDQAIAAIALNHLQDSSWLMGREHERCPFHH